MKKRCVFILLFVHAIVLAQDNFKPIDSLLALYDKPGSPGAAVVVIQNGEIIYNKQSGLANVENKEVLDRKSVFYLASVSKQFTAACIMLLEQQGKLSLNDKLSKYFPDFPEYADKTTIKHLLNHSSGIKDIGALAFIKGENDDDYTDLQVKNLLKKVVPDFDAGTSFSYSNSGYWFLVQIVQQVSGKPIGLFARENIFIPLKMSSARYATRSDAAFSGKVNGYVVENDIYVTKNSDGNAISGAGVYATADDLVKWLKEIETNTLLGKTFWNRMLNEETFSIGKDAVYSKGFFKENYGKYQYIQHGGDVDGFHTMISYFPEKKTGIIILSNDDEADTWLLHRAAANLTLGLTYRHPKKAEPVITLPIEKLRQYAGIYEGEGLQFEFSAVENTMHVVQLWNGSEYDVSPVSEEKFTFLEAQADFEFKEINAGKAHVVNITQGGETLMFKRTTDYKFPDYSIYQGCFYCKEIEAYYTFSFIDGKLVYFINDHETHNVDLVLSDTVSIMHGDADFERDSKGEITGFTLNHPRVKNLIFRKIVSN